MLTQYRRYFIYIFNFSIYTQYMRHSRRTKRALSIATNPSDGAMGEKSVCSIPAEISVYSPTDVQL